MDEIKTKDFTCWKEIGGEGEMIACGYKTKASEVYIHPSAIILANVKCDNISDDTIKCFVKEPREFIAGQRYSSDFDYCGMLRAGSNAKLSDGVKNLRKLSDSYEAVNYHELVKPLFEAIHLINKGKRTFAENKLKEFNKLSGKMAKEIC